MWRKLSAKIANGDIIPFYSEYMETDKITPPGYAMLGVCLVYEAETSRDRPSRNMQQVAQKSSIDIYTYITRSLTEAVGDGVVARLENLNIAFYDNSYVLAFAIAGSGLSRVCGNVDRAFWSIGLGGVCRSLFTSLIRNPLSPRRSFFDCTSLYLEDDLGKTIDHIIGYSVLTEKEGAEDWGTNLRNPRRGLYANI